MMRERLKVQKLNLAEEITLTGHDGSIMTRRQPALERSAAVVALTGRILQKRHEYSRGLLFPYSKNEGLTILPKMICTCGYVLHLGDIPCKSQYNFISDVDYEKEQGSLDAEELYLKMKMFFVCESCHRLWVFWNGFENPPQEYVPSSR
ncbi:hypothetical protein [Paenibacillus sp. UNC496MF]|uniref:hypothetical protein n=1 Tax=Paenibacillus sp. UNC496MF TaxID=1502753 RepID=UPI00210BE073|nr:hypothetical protein [Paenibacillus sp. UNC496MF]